MSKRDGVKGWSLASRSDDGGDQLDKLNQHDQHGLGQRVVASIELFDWIIWNLLSNLGCHLKKCNSSFCTCGLNLSSLTKHHHNNENRYVDNMNPPILKSLLQLVIHKSESTWQRTMLKPASVNKPSFPESTITTWIFNNCHEPWYHFSFAANISLNKAYSRLH